MEGEEPAGGIKKGGVFGELVDVVVLFWFFFFF